MSNPASPFIMQPNNIGSQQALHKGERPKENTNSKQSPMHQATKKESQGRQNRMTEIQLQNREKARSSSSDQNYQNLVYPSLNVVCSPRIFQQKIRTDRVSLTRYRERIFASGCKKSYDDHSVPIQFMAKFVKEDGMIFNMRHMRIKERGQSQLPAPGAIKFLICICMYNESRHAINLTLKGIYDNLPHFEREGFSIGDIAVVLIQDGILKLVSDRATRTLANGADSMVQFYAQMDLAEGKSKCDLKERINVVLDEVDNYNRKGMADFVARNNDFPPSIQKNVSLLYQNMWWPTKTPNDINQQPQKDGDKKLRVFSCFKHTNGTKLSSHLWFFEGFCRYIEPQFCVLLDVGTKPDETGLLNLISGFVGDSSVGGVTGFMSVDSQFKSQEGDGGKVEKEKGFFQRNFYSIEKAQEYEYIISHFLDKNSESALGFLHVLPGAWSAYRYKALIKSDGYEPNLLQKSYFKMILNPNLEQRDFMEANMYLAEDRILSLGIYCQTDSAYTLKYVPNAVAYTDPMKTHKHLMNQRRRWINSSLFAFLYVFRNYYYNVMDSNHNFFRKYLTLNLSMFIALLSFVNTYFTPSLYFFILYSTVIQLGGYGSAWQHIAKTVSFAYAVTFLVAVGGGLTGRAWTDRAQIVSYILGGFTYLLLFLVIYNVLFIYLRVSDGSLQTQNFIVLSLIIMLIINLGASTFVTFMHIFTHPGFVWKLVLDSVSYLSFQGAYSQVMVAHSFCNVDDVSWGTKGSTSAHGKKKYQVEKVFFVSSWLFYNGLLSAIFIYIDIVIPARTSTGGGSVLIGIAIYGSAFLLVKSAFAVWYHFKWILFDKCCGSFKQDVKRKDNFDQYWKQHAIEWRKMYNQDNFPSRIYRR